MKARKETYAILTLLLLILHTSISTPYVSAPPPALPPDQFIGELFPNCSKPLGLPHTNVIITVNASKSLKNVDITFDANYTIYNPENTTIIQVIVPFQLALNITKCTFEVYVNDTQIPYDLFTIRLWNENITEIDVYYLPLWSDFYPITFIRSNVTLFKNSSSIIRCYFSGLMKNSLDSRDAFFIAYYLGTSLEWIRNTTGRVEVRAYGKQPVFSYGGENCQVIDIDGGQSFINKWDNIKNQKMAVGIRYHRELTPFEKFLDIMALDNSYTWVIFISIAIFILGIVFIIKNRKRREQI